MSVPPGPPDRNGTSGAGVPFVIWTSKPSANNHQTTLEQLVESLDDPEGRWEAILMLRVLQLRLHPAIAVAANDFQRIGKGSRGRKLRAVFGRGRLSEVGRYGSSRIRNNQIHIDEDWFGTGTPFSHWWNSNQFDSGAAEKEATRGLLHFLEATLNLAPSAPDPTTPWSWPAGVENSADWVTLANTVPAPDVSASPHVILEWHEGENPHALACGQDLTNVRFWYSTPEHNRMDL